MVNLMGARRWVAVVLTAAALVSGVASRSGRAHADSPTQPRWIAAWESALAGPAADGRDPSFSGGRLYSQTIREITRPTVAGAWMRVVLSNRFGTQPLRLSTVSAGIRQHGADLDPATVSDVTFNHVRSATVPPGSSLTSDPVPMPVAPGLDLAVSIAVMGQSSVASWHPNSLLTSYITDVRAGDHAMDSGGAAFRHPLAPLLWVSRIEVLAQAPAATVVALGDSLTDGWRLPVDGRDRWTDVLADRLAASEPAQRRAVVNAALAGNRIVHDGRCPYGCDPGRAAVLRADEDVFNVPGADSVIVLEGTNDLGGGASARAVINGLSELVDRAHRHGLSVVLMTIPPWGRTGADDARRGDVNSWIRTDTTADSFVDADLLLRDQSLPQRLDPRYDVGDGLHLSIEGMRMLAEAVDPLALGSIRRG